MTMKITIQQLFDATLLISQIIREQRPLPQKGKYRLARMHPKLDKEFQKINDQRNEMIKTYDFHPLVMNPLFGAPVGEGMEPHPQLVPSTEFAVPAEKMPEFEAKWNEFAKEEIEIEIEPIPFEQLDLGDNVDGSIAAHEIIVLGDLIR